MGTITGYTAEKMMQLQSTIDQANADVQSALTQLNDTITQANAAIAAAQQATTDAENASFDQAQLIDIIDLKSDITYVDDLKSSVNKAIAGGLNPIDLRILESVQVADLQLPDTSALLQTAVKTTKGDWYVSQANPGTIGSAESTKVSRCTSVGSFVSSMTFTNAGHGTVIAVEELPDGDYIWLQFQTINATTGAATGFGIAKIKWQAPAAPATNVDIARSNAGLTFVNVFTTNPTFVALDAASDRIVIENNNTAASQITYELRALSDVKAGVNNLLGSVGPISNASGVPTPQGFAIIGNQLFRYTGNSSGSMPATITVWDMLTGTQSYVKDVSGTALEGNGTWPGNYHEPEGLSLYRSPSGRASLLFGFAIGNTPSRYAKVFAFTETDNAALLSRRVEAMNWALPVDPNMQCRGPGLATSMAQLTRPGWYYLGTLQFGSMTDKPSDYGSGGYWLFVSGQATSSGSDYMQMLIWNKAPTAANGTPMWIRRVHPGSESVAYWSRISMSSTMAFGT